MRAKTREERMREQLGMKTDKKVPEFRPLPTFGGHSSQELLNAGYVLAKFYNRETDTTEQLWVEVDKVKGGIIEGTLYQEPLFINAHKLDRVTVKPEQIVEIKPKPAGIVTSENLKKYYPLL